MALIYGYVGTYTSPEAPGTYRFRLDTQSGALDAPELIYPQTNTKYAAWSQGLLATVTEKDGAAGVALLSTAGAEPSLLDTQLLEKTTACFLTWQDGLLYSANYHDGHVLIYTAKDCRLSLAHRLYVEDESGCHQVIFHGRWLLVPCLRRDQVLLFDREEEFRQVGVLEFPAGTGPRHGVFTKDHRRFYLVSETSNQLFTYRVDGLSFTLRTSSPSCRRTSPARGTPPLSAFPRMKGLSISPSGAPGPLPCSAWAESALPFSSMFPPRGKSPGTSCWCPAENSCWPPTGNLMKLSPLPWKPTGLWDLGRDPSPYPSAWA